jgi:hypothetical protein
MYVYNISGGVANIFYQSCAQIDNNQHIFRCQDVKYLKGRFTRMSKAQATSSWSMYGWAHRPQSQGNSSNCLYVVFRLGKILLLDRCFHPSPYISSSIILIYTLFYYYYHIFYFYSFKGCIHQITTKLLI